MNDSRDTFSADFAALLGHTPFPWQARLFNAMAAGAPGRWPAAVDVPTGLGKTAVVACWLLALTANPGGVPRRLAYVVNRRTIVDQVTDVVGEIWKNLREKPDLAALRKRLASDVAGRKGEMPGDALAISTLRGEFADNGAWRADPARASVVVGTPDLIGSALLFAGYRVGSGSFGVHAGLLGQDVLLVHDEAHLSPALQVLLDRIAAVQREDGSPRPVRVLALSATRRGGEGRQVLSLDAEDLEDSTVQDRIGAHKRLLVDASGPEEGETPKAFEKRWLETMVNRAWEKYHDKQVRVIVYVRSPEDARTIHDALATALRKENKKTADGRLALLTGRLRGKERDDLAGGPVLTALREAKAVEGKETTYLVATSAGEVGADLDADHMVCDLTTADALVQRLGRVNRRGTRKAADGCDVDLIAGPDAEPKPDTSAHGRWAARRETLKLLQSLPTGDDGRIDAGPRATREAWPIPDAAREPAPETLPLTEAMVSALSMTSIRRTRRVEGRIAATWPLLPDVATLIHGFVDDAAEVTLAWRAEVASLVDAERSAQDVESLAKRVLEACPVRAAERLTLPVGVAAEWIKNRVKKLDGESHVALLVGRAVERLPLNDGVEPDDLAGRTLLLPGAFGGLDASGTVDANPGKENPQIDFGDTDDARRYLLRQVGDGYESRRLAGDDEAWKESDATTHAAAVASLLVGKYERRLTIPLREPDEVENRLDLIITRTTAGRSGKLEDVKIDAHNKAVHNRAERFVKALDLPPAWQSAVTAAAARHDTGKGRALWQTYAGNRNFDEPVAKSLMPRPDWRVLDGYRHEYGSLLDALGDGVSDPLTLHLIAAHHGRARPHFERPFDPERKAHPDASPAAVALRFDALQKRHGPWGLAWLEALVRSADRTVSAGDAADDFDVEEDADA